MDAITETAAPIGHNRPERVLRFKRVCTECGGDFRAAMRHADFCSNACRRSFNNRRLTRGAELYDLIMVMRHERGLAVVAGVWKLICRLAAEFRDEDLRERDGRKSWRSPSEIVARRPYLRATASNITIKRKPH